MSYGDTAAVLHLYYATPGLRGTSIQVFFLDGTVVIGTVRAFANIHLHLTSASTSYYHRLGGLISRYP